MNVFDFRLEIEYDWLRTVESGLWLVWVNRGRPRSMNWRFSTDVAMRPKGEKDVNKGSFVVPLWVSVSVSVSVFCKQKWERWLVIYIGRAWEKRVVMGSTWRRREKGSHVWAGAFGLQWPMSSSWHSSRVAEAKCHCQLFRKVSCCLNCYMEVTKLAREIPLCSWLWITDEIAVWLHSNDKYDNPS